MFTVSHYTLHAQFLIFARCQLRAVAVFALIGFVLFIPSFAQVCGYSVADYRQCLDSS